MNSDHQVRTTRRKQRFPASRLAFAAIATGLVGAVSFGALTAQTKIKHLPGSNSSNYRPFDQINKKNVAQLEVAWFYPYQSGNFSPVYANDILYGLGRGSS